MKLFFLRFSKKPKRKPAAKYLAYKEKARKLILERLKCFNQHYGLTWNRVAVKNTKRRWGSCSKKGNLNFCYRIVFLDPELSDYIIVHELCHLKQFNHSKEFWLLVAQTVPNYALLRKRLRSGVETLNKSSC